jgi:hypothetical protein
VSLLSLSRHVVTPHMLHVLQHSARTCHHLVTTAQQNAASLQVSAGPRAGRSRGPLPHGSRRQMVRDHGTFVVHDSVGSCESVESNKTCHRCRRVLRLATATWRGSVPAAAAASMPSTGPHGVRRVSQIQLAELFLYLCDLGALLSAVLLQLRRQYRAHGIR